MSQLNVITIDKGILPPGDVVKDFYAQISEKIETVLEPGDSFFQPGLTAGDFTVLIKWAKDTHGWIFEARDTHLDEVYQLPGVRIWAMGTVNKTTVTVEGGKTFWQNKRSKALRECNPGVLPVDITKWRQIAPAEYRKLLELSQKDDEVPFDKPGKASKKSEEKTSSEFFFAEETYWHHAESGSTFALEPGDHLKLLSSADGALCAQIDKADFQRVMAEQELAYGGNFWKDPESPVVVEFLPGRYPAYSPTSLKVRATRDEYVHYQNKQLKETYWRRADGTCVAVPLKKLERAMQTAGAVQITVNEFRDWQQAQNDDEL